MAQTIHGELATEMLVNLIGQNWPSIANSTDPNGIAGYWNGSDPAKPVTPSSNPDPLLVLIVTAVIDLCNNYPEFGYNQPLTATTRKALYTAVTTELQAIATQVSAVATAFNTYTTALP